MCSEEENESPLELLEGSHSHWNAPFCFCCGKWRKRSRLILPGCTKQEHIQGLMPSLCLCSLLFLCGTRGHHLKKQRGNQSDLCSWEFGALWSYGRRENNEYVWLWAVFWGCMSSHRPEVCVCAWPRQWCLKPSHWGEDGSSQYGVVKYIHCTIF